MSLTLTQTATAVGPNSPASFLGIGGTSPYTYSVTTQIPGGTINASTGAYIAPSVANSDPKLAYDTIQVVDSLGAKATAQILVGNALLLFCEIIQNQMGLANGRVYLWDQKIYQPSDYDLYIAIGVPFTKCFSNVNEMVPDNTLGLIQNQFVAMMATLDINVISRGPAARDRKEEVIMALNSVYSEQQQDANGFKIGIIPPGSQFRNLSNIDGAAIPYRYSISTNMQYVVSKPQPAQYFDTFVYPTPVVNT